MNQEQLLDQVAELINNYSDAGIGLVLLLYKDDFSVIFLPAEIDSEQNIVEVFRSSDIRTGLPPSRWFSLSKKLWALKSKPVDSIKFPGHPSSVRGKPGRRSTPEIEPPKSG
jgi:hypothetical protein